MMSNTQSLLAAVTAARMGWMTGQPSQVDLPELADLETKEAQLRLLSMDAQLRAVTGAAVTELELAIPTDFPTLERSTPPEVARGWFRRVWNGKQQDQKIHILHLLDQRGYIAHPFDFMPQNNWSELPAAYAPLLEWAGQTPNSPQDTTADPYGAYSSSETQKRFMDLRRDEPKKATDWLISEMGSGNAQKRLRLLRDVGNFLDLADLEFLTHLIGTDRSKKVTALAIQILRRNGGETQLPDDLSAFDYLEKPKAGVLNSKIVIGTPKKINPTRVHLLTQTIGQLGFHDIARKLELTSDALIAAWDWDNADYNVTDALQRCIFDTGRDEDCLALIERFASAPNKLSCLGPEHMNRLKNSMRDKVIDHFIKALTRDDWALWELLHVLVTWSMTGLSKAQSKALWDRAHRHKDFNPKKSKDNNGLEDNGLEDLPTEIFNLAMCLQPLEAQAALDVLGAKGVHSANPILAPLHLNVALLDISQEGS